MSKRQEAAKLTRERIVNAVKSLNARKGLSAVSVEEIVTEAQVCKGSFYVYFKRKEDIAAEIAFENFNELKERTENFSGSNFEKLGYFLNESVRRVEKQGLSLCREWLKGALYPQKGDGKDVAKLNPCRDLIVQLLTRAKESGELDDGVSAKALADIIMAEYYGVIALWNMTDGGFNMQRRMEQFTAALDFIIEVDKDESPIV